MYISHYIRIYLYANTSLHTRFPHLPVHACMFACLCCLKLSASLYQAGHAPELRIGLRLSGFVLMNRVLLWSPVPNGAILSHTSNTPPNDIGNYPGRCISILRGTKAHLRLGPVPRPSMSTVKPMTSTADAKRLLEAMRAATTHEARLGTLAAVDKSPKHCVLQFCQDGGLEILEKWLRKNPEARYSCLPILQKLLVALLNLQKAKLIPAVIAIQQHVKANAEAASVLDRWRSAGFLLDEKVERTPPTSSESLAWRPRFEQTRFPEPMEDLDDEEPEAPQAQARPPPLCRGRGYTIRAERTRPPSKYHWH